MCWGAKFYASKAWPSSRDPEGSGTAKETETGATGWAVGAIRVAAAAGGPLARVTSKAAGPGSYRPGRAEPDAVQARDPALAAVADSRPRDAPAWTLGRHPRTQRRAALQPPAPLSATSSAPWPRGFVPTRRSPGPAAIRRGGQAESPQRPVQYQPAGAQTSELSVSPSSELSVSPKRPSCLRQSH